MNQLFETLIKIIPNPRITITIVILLARDDTYQVRHEFQVGAGELRRLLSRPSWWDDLATSRRNWLLQFLKRIFILTCYRCSEDSTTQLTEFVTFSAQTSPAEVGADLMYVFKDLHKLPLLNDEQVLWRTKMVIDPILIK